MASWGRAGTGARTAIGVGGAVAVGALVWWMLREAARDTPVPEVTATLPAAPDVAPTPAAPTPSAPAPVEPLVPEATAALPVAPDANPAAPGPVGPVVPEATATSPGAPDALPDADAAVPEPVPVLVPPVPPTFDLVRVEADGSAQVAGRGAPDARVVVQVDGFPVAEAAVAGDGAFVALFTLPPNPLPSLLSLEMVMPDGTRVPGRETVALAPIAGPAAPMVVAEDAAPEAPADAPAEAPMAAPEVAGVGEVVGAAPEVVALPETVALPEAAVPPETVAPPAALLLTEQGVKVLQAPVVEGQGVVSIDTIAYTETGAVQFGGRGAVGQVVRLYLDNAALAEVAVPAGGQWGITTQSDIAPGLYTLRADQVDSTGKVTSRFETPFKRESVAALAEAVAPKADLGAGAGAAAVAPAGSAVPEVQVAGAPGPVPGPGPLPVPPLPAPPPLISAPSKIPTVESVAPELVAPESAVPTESGVATAPGAIAAQVAPDAGPAAPDPAARVVAAAAPAADTAPSALASPVRITVQPGYTLWAIARAELGHGIRYVQVFEANRDKIRDPDLIYPGQVFTIPAEP